MFDAAIIGAGELGGAVAHRLAKQEIVGAICLVDEAGTIASGKALDLMQSAPIEGFSTRVAGAAELAFASSAPLVIVADRAKGGEWGGEDALALLKRLTGPSAPVVICAGSAQRDILERAVREGGASRARVIGTAPEALASAARAIVAQETGCSAADVSLTVLGVPPDRIVVPWEDASIGGLSAARVLDAPTLRRLESRVARLWPPGPIALAAAAVKAVRAMRGLSRAAVSAFVAPDDSAGRRARAAAFPIRLGEHGIEDVLMPQLTPHDRVLLDTAILL
jgi:malate dehydrogenase